MVENENTEHSSLSSFYSSQEKSKRKSEINIGEKSALTLIKVISEILADICDQSNQSKEDKLILASFIAAIKYNSDDFYSLGYYAKFGGVSQKEVEALEYQFITLLDFRLYVEEKLYDKYNKYLRKLELDDDDDCDYNSDG